MKAPGSFPVRERVKDIGCATSPNTARNWTRPRSRARQRCLRQTRSCLTKGFAPVIAGSGFCHSLLGLDRAGRRLTPIYTWADAGATKDAARLRIQLNERSIQQRTGCMLRASVLPARGLAAPHPAEAFPSCRPLGLARGVDF
jgi:hypothetical protein